jgi:hypothetical protein
LLIGSDHYRRALKQFGINLDDQRNNDIMEHLDVDVCQGTGVDAADEAFVLRVAHHVQLFLSDISESPEGIRLGGYEELSLKCCQQALRHAFVKAAETPPVVAHGAGGLRPQPYYAPPGAARCTLVSLELEEKQQTTESSTSGTPSRRKKRRPSARKIRSSTSSKLSSSDTPMGILPTAFSTSSLKVEPSLHVSPSAETKNDSGTAWESEHSEEASQTEISQDRSQVYLKDCHYYLWMHDRVLYVHRAETLVSDHQALPQPLDQALSSHEVARAYHLDRDVEEIAMCPIDDRYIVLTLRTNLVFRWKIDGEIKNWIEGLQEQVPRLGPELNTMSMHDILHCWQPQMEGENSSCFQYSLDTLPYLASNVYLETVTGRAVPAVMWYSHGGAVLSFALIRDLGSGAAGTGEDSNLALHQACRSLYPEKCQMLALKEVDLALPKVVEANARHKLLVRTCPTSSLSAK